MALPRPRGEEWWFTTWDIQSKVWPITQGSGVTVAVLDSGVNAKLPDLAGVVLPGTNTNGGQGDGRADIDTEEGGHGTAMATLIAAQGGGTRMVGVAPQVRILPVVTGGEASWRSAIRYATDHGAKVINVSQSQISAVSGALRCSPELQTAVNYALQRDVVVVASAGNTGHQANRVEVPASCPGVLAVGAVDAEFRPWKQTQRQPYVSVAAPGVAVGSTDGTGTFSNRWSGTSQAAALTSAVVALVRARYPQMSAREVVQRVIASALDVGPKGKDDQTGYGLIRPSHALVDKVPANAPNPVFEAWDRVQKEQGAPAAPPSEVPRAADEERVVPISVVLALGGAGVLALALILGGVIMLVRRRQV